MTVAIKEPDWFKMNIGDRVENALDSALVDQHETEPHDKLVAEVRKLEAEVKEKTEWWQEYVQHYGDLEEEMEQLETDRKALVRYVRAYKAWVRVKDVQGKGKIIVSNEALAEFRAASSALSQELRDEISEGK